MFFWSPVVGVLLSPGVVDATRAVLVEAFWRRVGRQVKGPLKRSSYWAPRDLGFVCFQKSAKVIGSSDFLVLIG